MKNTEHTEMPAVRPISEMRVLIADDNADGADVLSALIFLEFGCQVATAYDGKQALALAMASPRDVLLLDLHMPGYSGLEVARRARSIEGDRHEPLLLAITGRTDLESDLAVVDARFDRAFAKPIDHATLFATMRSHWEGARPTRPLAQFKLFETLTQAAREVGPLLTANRQQLSFDADGPELVVHGDEAALHSAFYRLLCGALDLVDGGIVLLSAHSVAERNGTHAVTVNVAGSVKADVPSGGAEVLQRLGLTSDGVAGRAPAGGVMARGACPNCGGEVSYVFQPREGVLLRLELSVQTVDTETSPRADGARVWIVDSRNIESAVLERRFQRLGWHVWRFPSVTDALSQADAAAFEDLPAMLLVRDDSRMARSAVSALRSRMPDRTHCVLLVGTGATEPVGFEAETRWERHIEPLSPGDLAWASLHAVDAESVGSAPLTISHTLRARRKVLVVDDNEINRIVASGLLEALGYEVACVNDGLDAIEYCKRMPPDVVLMDVNMPVLGGIDASRRIVELQKTGAVAPFAIVVATADDSPETEARCMAAGVTGYLCKPLRLEALRDELRRVGVNERATRND